MYFRIVQPLVCKKGDKASLCIILAGRALLVKMPITLDSRGIIGSNFVYLCILTLSSHWYEKGDKASTSIILAGQAHLVKMLITLEPCDAFRSNFEYLSILRSNCWYAKR